MLQPYRAGDIHKVPHAWLYSCTTTLGKFGQTVLLLLA